MKFSKKDKVAHFVWNLWQLIEFWEKQYKPLYDDVEKVKHTKKFKDFCVEQFDLWNVQVNTLYKYFKK